MTTKLKILLVVLILFAVSFFYLKKEDESFVELGGKRFKVEVMSTPEERSKGLSGREELCLDCGMIFVFPEPGKYSFWMKDMNFDLDIIWIREGKIVHIEENLPFDYQGTITPNKEADSVLEVNSGSISGLGIKKGNSVKLKL